MPEKLGPCLEKNCAECCNPVKIGHRKDINPQSDGFEIPKDNSGEEIWEELEETWAPVSDPDIVRIKLFKCKKFDSSAGRCVDYKNRPEICKNTSCINAENDESPDEQHRKVVNTEYIKMKK